MQSASRFYLAIAAVAATLWIQTAAAQVQPPNTPAGHQLANWLQAFNSGDKATMERFISEQYPTRPFKSVEPDIAFHAQTGGFDLLEIKESADTHLVAIVKEHDSETAGAKLALEVEPAEPHRIVKFDLQPGAQISVNTPRLSEPELIKTLRDELGQRAAAGRFSGAVLIAKRGKPVFTGAYGLADREHNVPNTVETRFRVGSMNKMFTAVSILQLAQRGKIALNAPLAKYLPDYPNKSFASNVTIHQLLTHTGGAGDVFVTPQYAAHRLELRSHQDFIRMFGDRDPQYEPGTQWAYSNYGFILLGAVIEKVSGEDYFDYVRKHIYEPAGMSHSGSDPQPPADLAVGYTKSPGSTSLKPNTDTLPYRGTAAGGGYSTVGDLLKFATALTGHKLLNARYTELLTTGKVEALGGKYAYGMIEYRDKNGVRSFGHGGNGPGMDANLVIYPKSGYVVVALANLDLPAAHRVSDFITNRLP